MKISSFWVKQKLASFFLASLTISFVLKSGVSYANNRSSLLAQGSSYLQRLAEADRFYQGGDLQAASRIQKEVKPIFEGGTAATEALSDINSPRLSGAARVYWRNAQEGIQQNLESKIFQSLNLLTENYPDFLPGHLTLTEACEKDPIGCERNAKGNQPNNAIDVIDRATSLYPDRTDLLDAHIGILVRSAEATEKPYPYLEASILSRQYALSYPDRQNASYYRQQADDLFSIYQLKVEELVASNVLIQGLLTNDQSVLFLMLQGESTLGEYARDQTISQVGLLDNSDAQAYVNRVGQKLAQWAGRPDFTYEFFVTPEEDFNAYALPGGKIFVTLGLLKLMDTEAQLAGILSHEIAHSTLSHAYLGYSDDLLTNSALGSRSILGTLFNQERSRKQERASDILGTRVLARSGYAADGMHSVMQIFEALEGNRSRNWSDDHPVSRDRVHYLENLITRNQYNRYAYEGVTAYQAMKTHFGGVNTSEPSYSPSSNAAQPTPPPVSSPPSPRSSSQSLTSGTIIPLSQTQVRDNVSIQLREAEIMSPNSYKVKFTVDNQSNANFIFVLSYSEVIDSTGEPIKAKFTCQAGQDSDLSLGESSMCEAWILNSPWRSGQEQESVLVIKESSSSARVFRISF